MPDTLEAHLIQLLLPRLELAYPLDLSIPSAILLVLESLSSLHSSATVSLTTLEGEYSAEQCQHLESSLPQVEMAAHLRQDIPVGMAGAARMLW